MVSQTKRTTAGMTDNEQEETFKIIFQRLKVLFRSNRLQKEAEIYAILGASNTPYKTASQSEDLN